MASRSSSGATLSVTWVGREASSNSRCERTETNSPAPIDSAPAKRPAIPETITIELETPVAPIPMMSARLETKPSLAPNTAARKLPDSLVRPSVARARIISSWTASSAAIASVASGSSRYGERDSARCSSASTKTVPKCRARNMSALERREGRARFSPCGPRSRRQCSACRSSATATWCRISPC